MCIRDRLVRRETFEAIDGFDETLETCEDCDLGYRLSSYGKLLLCNTAVIVHHGESKSLAEVFRREAWRTKGNFSLARKRVGDWKNWASLMLPPVLLGSFLVATLWTVLSLLGGKSLLLPIAILLAALIAPLLLALRAGGTASNVVDLLRRYVVMVVYLAGRACGLVFRFQRVAR